MHIFLQGRFDGPEKQILWLANPTRTVCLVNESWYQFEARRAFGDLADLIVQAEGSSPDDRGLERGHHYLRADGSKASNAEVRDHINDHVQYWRLDGDELIAEAGEIGVVLMPGELRAPRDGGGGYDAGQAMLVINKDGHPRWFSILNKADGSRAWTGDEQQIQERLQRVADAFDLLEGPTSTAGRTRRAQFESLKLFDVPMSNPSGRENVWRIAAAVRQALLPDIVLAG